MVAIELSLVVNMAFATVSPACDETRAKKSHFGKISTCLSGKLVQLLG